MNVRVLAVVLLFKDILGLPFMPEDRSWALSLRNLFKDEDNKQFLECIAKCRTKKTCSPKTEISIEDDNDTCRNTCRSHRDCLERQACCSTKCGKQCIISGKFQNDYL